MVDWNGDGQHDLTDDYIGYQLYHEQHSGGSEGGGLLGWLLLGLGVLIVILLSV